MSYPEAQILSTSPKTPGKNVQRGHMQVTGESSTVPMEHSGWGGREILGSILLSHSCMAAINGQIQGALSSNSVPGPAGVTLAQ